MPLVVTQVTPPAAEPVTLAQAKNYLKVDFDDDDLLIESMITAARRNCEVIGKVSFANTVFDMADDAFPFTTGAFNRQVRQFYGQFQSGQGAVYPGVLALNAGVITFPRAPLVSVQAVNYLDPNGQAQVMDPSTYVVKPGAPGRMQPVFGQIWPVTLPIIGAVTVRFTAGYGPDASTLPANAVVAVLTYLEHLYWNRGDSTAKPPVDAVANLLGCENNAGGYA